MHLAFMLLVVGTAAPVLDVDPVVVEPGGIVAFLLQFPPDAQGAATLLIGDGRSEQINTVVGQVDVFVDAPGEPGTYTARLLFQQDGQDAEHMVTYTVQAAAGRASPAPFLLLALAAAAWWRR